MRVKKKTILTLILSLVTIRRAESGCMCVSVRDYQKGAGMNMYKEWKHKWEWVRGKEVGIGPWFGMQNKPCGPEVSQCPNASPKNRKLTQPHKCVFWWASAHSCPHRPLHNHAHEKHKHTRPHYNYQNRGTEHIMHNNSLFTASWVKDKNTPAEQPKWHSRK